MTFAERVQAVAKKGFTDRQAGFLVTVMLHSGVCISRQYCAYARIVRGQKVFDFFASLVAKRFATSYSAAHRRAHIYHVHSKPLYAGEAPRRDRHDRIATCRETRHWFKNPSVEIPNKNPDNVGIHQPSHASPEQGGCVRLFVLFCGSRRSRSTRTSSYQAPPRKRQREAEDSRRQNTIVPPIPRLGSPTMPGT